MEYKMMHCYSKNSNLLSLIDVNAISEITWHEDGIYIYWRKIVQDYEEIEPTTERAGCIICDWTKVEKISLDTLMHLHKQGTHIILRDTAVYTTDEVLAAYYTIKEES
jgi:hypothetical protein